MNRADVRRIELEFQASPLKVSLSLSVTQQSDGKNKTVRLAGGTPADRNTLGGLFRRWGAQLADGRPLTVDLNDAGTSLK